MKESIGIDMLEERLNNLEKRVYGNNDVDSIRQPVVDVLTSIHTRIQSAITGREKIANGLKRVNELKKLLDLDETDKLTLSEAAKLEFVLAEEDRIRQTLDSLQKVEDLKFVLDSEHIRAAASQGEKLMALSQIQTNQQQQADDVTEEVQRLLLTYNDIVTTLSKQFVLWDETLTQLEISAQPKKILE